MVAFGCPLGSLTTELAKDSPELQLVSLSAFEIIKNWISKQFSELGFENAEDKSMDMLARMQWVTLVCCAFKDVKFLERSHTEIRAWLNNQILS